jgi:hypothetical protein
LNRYGKVELYEGLGLGITHVNEAYPIKQLNKIISSKRITRGKLGYGGAAGDLKNTSLYKYGPLIYRS